MPRTSACLMALGLALSIPVGCVKSVFEDEVADDEAGDESEDESDDESDDESGADETSSDETKGDETEGDATEGDETEGDETEDDETEGDENDDPDPPKPCTWTHFPSQYGIGNLGQNCGPLSRYDATSEDFEIAFACLQDAYDAEVAAFVTVSWTDGGDNTRRSEWYVRPPKEGKPRRIAAQYFRKYVEEGPQPAGEWTIESCANFVLNCDFPEFGFPDFDCVACTQPVTMVCGTTEN